MRQHGFTLIELLIVLAVLGILMGLFGFSYLRSIRAAEVREGANQIAADLRSARASAQRRSEGATLRWGAGSTLNTYTLELPTGTGTPRTVNLPRGVTFCSYSGAACVSTAGTVTYSAPHGEKDATGDRFLVQSTTPNIPRIEVRVVGVTGRVMLVAVP